MADTVAVHTQFSGKRRMVVHLTCVSDGTGESAVTKIDRSAITGPNGQTPNTIAVVSRRWDIQGFSYVKLAWHHNAGDVTIALMSGKGYTEYESSGYLHDSDTTNADAADGDITLTSSGAALGATYDIDLEVTY